MRVLTHPSWLDTYIWAFCARAATLAVFEEFDRRPHCEIGVPCYLGTDRWGTQVYALGTGWLSSSLEKAICDLVELSSPHARACFCSVRGYLDSKARLGGFISRRCGLVSLGRSLVSASLKERLPYIKEAVDFCLDLSSKWNDNQGQHKGEVTWVHGPTAGRTYRRGRGSKSRTTPGD
ncbi:MAG: DUF3189 family protein [Bacillota bacterium]